MIRIFLSHSSLDKDFVRKLATDLRTRNFDVWLDEWEIRVGQCIPARIEQGLQDANFVVLVLSPSSCSSPWVEREWRTKYWAEVEQNQVLILPVLLADCEIPGLLKTKRYADFRWDYEAGFSELLGGLAPNTPAVAETLASPSSLVAALDLLQRAQARSEPLSLLFVEVLRQSSSLKDEELLEFARDEIAGYSIAPGLHSPTGERGHLIEHRRMAGYLSFDEINPSYMGWAGEIGTALEFMHQKPDEFIPRTVIFQEPIAALEGQLPTSSHKKLLHLAIPASLISGEPSSAKLNFYAAGDTLLAMYERIRLKLVRALTAIALAQRSGAQGRSSRALQAPGPTGSTSATPREP